MIWVLNSSALGFDELAKTWNRSGTLGLFANTEIPEDSLEQILISGFTRDEPELVKSGAQVGDEEVGGVACSDSVRHG